MGHSRKRDLPTSPQQNNASSKRARPASRISPLDFGVSGFKGVCGYSPGTLLGTADVAGIFSHTIFKLMSPRKNGHTTKRPFALQNIQGLNSQA